MTTNQTQSLGDIKSLFLLSLPIIISHMSSSIMLFVDRLFIAQLGADSLNSAMMTNMIVATFTLAFISLTSIAEVFVGQYNGSKQFDIITRPVWQMIWLSLASMALFIPLGLFTGEWVLNPTHYQLGQTYYQIILTFSFLPPLISAIAAFFIGICNTRIIIISTLFANIVNIVLDYALIFGHWGFPELGMQGAAIATIIGYFLQAFILFTAFLKSSPHKNSIGIDWEEMYSCIKIGLPTGLSYLLEIGGWTFLMYVITDYPAENLIQSMSISILGLFYFMGDGLFKAISTQAANIIGANQLDLLKKLLRSSFIIFFCIIILIYLPLVFLPDPLIGLFIKDTFDATIFYEAHLALFGVWIYLILDGSAWIYGSFLRAGGDTFTMLLINVLSAWLVALLPSIYLLKVYHVHISFLWIYVFTSYAVCNLTLQALRYYSGRWLKLDLHKIEN
ncbi:MAG TPA: MATE family efflux transporter [Gammaproteobacteria bacterium]|nr:MATE family efflux transporter [Gammaproteobacteria bacterium]